MDKLNITWTNDAISTLDHRDRYSQKSIIREIRTILGTAPNPRDSEISQLLQEGSKIYVTPVRQQAYHVLWEPYAATGSKATVYDKVARIEIIGVFERRPRNETEAAMLIQKESWEYA